MDNEGEAMNNGHICQKEAIIAEHKRKLDEQGTLLKSINDGVTAIREAFTGTLTHTGFIGTIEGHEIRITQAESRMEKFDKFIDGQKNLFIKVVATAVIGGFIAAWIKGFLGGTTP